MPWTFLTDTMSLMELRKCATRSCRFRHALGTPGVVQLTGRGVELDFNNTTTRAAGQVMEGQPYLIPGGRWLLTFVRGTGAVSIACWDLAPGSVRVSPAAVHQLTDTHFNYPRFLVQSDAMSNRIVVLAHDHYDSW